MLDLASVLGSAMKARAQEDREALGHPAAALGQVRLVVAIVPHFLRFGVYSRCLYSSTHLKASCSGGDAPAAYAACKLNNSCGALP